MKYITTTRFIALILGTMAGCFGQHTYSAAPISIPGYDFARLIWIGDDGKTGFGSGQTINPYLAQCLTYQNGVATSIATPGAACQPEAANVGAYLFTVTPPNPNPYVSAPIQLFAYKNYQFFALPAPDGTAVYFSLGTSGVNPDGQIATTLRCRAPGGPADLTVASIYCAYRISTSGVFTRLPDLGDSSWATTINPNGDIAGVVTPPGSHTATAGGLLDKTGSLVVWSQGGAMKNVSSLTGKYPLGIPAAMNSKGQIAGPGYLYDGVSTIVSLQAPGASLTTPVAMNENGEVVGTYRTKPDDGIVHPFYYTNGTAVDLNLLVPDFPKNRLITDVSYINNAGQILVTTIDLGQSVSAITNGSASMQYLLTPSIPLTTPVISQVGSAASFAPGTASSSWITVLGLNLSTTTRQWTNSDFTNGKLPTSLDGVSVTINGEAAYIAYVSPTQINVLTPDDITAGPVLVQVTNSRGVSNSFTSTKSDPMPAFFTAGVKPFDTVSRGGFYIAALHADETPVGPSGLIAGVNFTPAKQGEELQLFGTGFGATTSPVSSGQLQTGADTLANQVSVLINGVPAQVVFAGRTGNGLDQINVIVPNVSPDGDVVVQAKVNGVATQSNLFLTVKF